MSDIPTNILRESAKTKPYGGVTSQGTAKNAKCVTGDSSAEIAMPNRKITNTSLNLEVTETTPQKTPTSPGLSNLVIKKTPTPPSSSDWEAKKSENEAKGETSVNNPATTVNNPATKEKFNLLPKISSLFSKEVKIPDNWDLVDMPEQESDDRAESGQTHPSGEETEGKTEAPTQRTVPVPPPSRDSIDQLREGLSKTFAEAAVNYARTVCNDKEKCAKYGENVKNVVDKYLKTLNKEQLEKISEFLKYISSGVDKSVNFSDKKEINEITELIIKETKIFDRENAKQNGGIAANIGKDLPLDDKDFFLTDKDFFLLFLLRDFVDKKESDEKEENDGDGWEIVDKPEWKAKTEHVAQKEAKSVVKAEAPKAESGGVSDPAEVKQMFTDRFSQISDAMKRNINSLQEIDDSDKKFALSLIGEKFKNFTVEFEKLFKKYLKEKCVDGDANALSDYRKNKFNIDPLQKLSKNFGELCEKVSKKLEQVQGEIFEEVKASCFVNSGEIKGALWVFNGDDYSNNAASNLLAPDLQDTFSGDF
jgi:transcriptional regulator of heat shock response